MDKPRPTGRGTRSYTFTSPEWMRRRSPRGDSVTDLFACALVDQAQPAEYHPAGDGARMRSVTVAGVAGAGSGAISGCGAAPDASISQRQRWHEHFAADAHHHQIRPAPPDHCPNTTTPNTVAANDGYDAQIECQAFSRLESRRLLQIVVHITRPQIRVAYR